MIEVACDAGGIAVSDNGLGLPESTLLRQLDFGVRASNREAYVAPTRGAQGNALKIILPMPSVVDPDSGQLIVQAHGKRHVIRCRVDQISQRPVIDHDVETLNTSGTTVRIEWQPRDVNGLPAWPFVGWRFDPECKIPQSKPQQLRTLVTGFAVFNPHATIRLNWFGEVTEYAATDGAFDKWKPCQPTSPHWYEQRHIERLIGAYITHDNAAGNCPWRVLLPARVAKMLKRHLPNLLSYFLYRITNATSEGFNSVIQALKYAARGFRSFGNYRTRILFYCGRLDLRPQLPCH